MRSMYWVLGCLLLTACSGDDDGDAAGGGAAATCVSGGEACGRGCDDVNQPCPFGFYCSAEGQCSQQCDRLDHPCAAGGFCNTNGMCSAGTSTGAGGTFGDGGLPITPPSQPGACADTTVSTSRTTPTVILIVDQSSSMEDDFGGDGSRWDVLRDFLLSDPDGLIAGLQSQVHFGLALYSAESGGDSPTPIGECPMVTTVAPAADNYAAIAQAYRGAEPIEDTPTGDSIDKIVQDLGLSDPDDQGNPIVFVLATDGEPDTCEQLDPQEGQQETISAVERAYTLGIRTFIISVGNEVSMQHQQDVANAGLGRGAGDPDAEYWVAGDDQSLRDALTAIVGGQLGCEIALNGRVTSGDPCRGTVTLNGEELACNDDNGWELLDEQHIRLLGSSCDRLKSGEDVMLNVMFPCSVGVVF